MCMLTQLVLQLTILKLIVLPYFLLLYHLVAGVHHQPGVQGEAETGGAGQEHANGPVVCQGDHEGQDQSDVGHQHQEHEYQPGQHQRVPNNKNIIMFPVPK